MVKKRKATPQSATLLDFFGDAAKHKKTKIQQISLHPKGKANSAARHAILPEDIIVIDSDEDSVEIARTGAGSSRIGHSAMKSRAKNLENKAPLPGNASLKKSEAMPKLPPTPPESNDLFGHIKRRATPDSLDDMYEDVTVPFGPPSALLNAVSCEASETESSSFGLPSLLLPSEAASSSGAPQAPMTDGEMKMSVISSCVLPKPEQPTPDVEEGPSLAGEDWATGDDEMELGDPELKAELEEEDAVDIDLTLDDGKELPPTAHDDVEVCPLCDKQLRGLDETAIHEHVNSCIDKMAGQSPLSPSNTKDPSIFQNARASPSKPLRPLSSFQAPLPIVIKTEPDSSPCVEEQGKPGVFSVLMSSHKENEAWKEASAVEDRNFRPTKGNGGRRKAPFYKVLQGMPIAVDAFRYGTIPDVTAYFLTHAHSDHYTNLSSNWKSGPIYCSEGTANLIIHMLAVDPKWVHPLPMDVATEIPNTNGVRVTLIEANHCPGSCLFLFEGRQTVNAGDSAFKSPFIGSSQTFRYLHCGDFRASPQHVLHPAIKGKRIDHVYLDTTYLDPKYCFPPQPQVITACAELAKRIVTGQSLHDAADIAKARQNKTMDSWLSAPPDKPIDKDIKSGKVLVVVGTYSIGKERIVKAIARALQTKVYCDSRKAAILRCQADPELHALLTKDPFEGGVHLVPLGVIASDRLKDYVERYKGHYSKAVGFRPTGWTFSSPAGTDMIPSVSTIISRSQSRSFTYAQLSPMKNSSAALQVYGVPYSEHSSFFELTCFAMSLDWGKMIATVNVGSENSRKKMGKWIERWEAERKKRAKSEVVEHRAPDYW